VKDAYGDVINPTNGVLNDPVLELLDEIADSHVHTKNAVLDILHNFEAQCRDTAQLALINDITRAVERIPPFRRRV
jgi:hypothetical protein